MAIWKKDFVGVDLRKKAEGTSVYYLNFPIISMFQSPSVNPTPPHPYMSYVSESVWVSLAHCLQRTNFLSPVEGSFPDFKGCGRGPLALISA